jgi:aspartyl-tRNA(Asn)/glutamyl-tRNA(Gln) amidotransferase subunit A
MVPDIFTHKNVMPHTVAEEGPLAGKRVVIQPNMSVRGWLTNAGSPALEGFIALEDGTVTARLREAGAILIGSTRMSGLGFGLAGDTGTQALVQGEADIALITDTMGEARVAAAASGLFGFKPSYGIVSRFGLIGLVPSMECCGIVAKSLQDIIAVIGAIAGEDDNDFSMRAEKLPDFGEASGLLTTRCVAGIIGECLATLNEVETKSLKAGLAQIEEAGFTIQELSLKDFGLFRTVHNIVGSVEASSSAGKYDGVRYGHRTASAKNWNDMYLNSRGESFGPLIKTYLFQGAYFQFENYRAFENACRIRGRLVSGAEALFKHVDVLVFPTRRLDHDAAAASTINGTYDGFSLTLPANITGQPALQIPSLALDSGADLGLQLIGPSLSDARLLSVAMRLSPTVEGAHHI